MMSRSCMASPARLTSGRRGWTRSWWIACWRCGTSEPSGSAVPRVPRPWCSICLVMRASSKQDCACRARHVPFTDSCASMDALLLACLMPPTPSSAPSRWSSGNSILQMPPRSRLSRRASSNIWSKRSTSSTPAPRCSSAATCAPILRRKPRCKRSLRRLAPHGLPLDRDPRWVGAPPGLDFPAALIRFCHSLGVAVLLCAPHHPQQNGFVERYNRTYQEECLAVHRPTTLSQVREVTGAFVEHYNWQRPQEAHRVWQSTSSHGVSRVAQLTQGN
jgi:Integrase core domain